MEKILKFRSFYDLMHSAVPDDHSNQVKSAYFADKLVKNGAPFVLDLGCGEGNSFDCFLNINPDIRWCGLDIPASPEVNSRKRNDLPFVTYDGLNIPFKSETFELIYSNQALEHVIKPRELLIETARILSNGGYFTGSVSYLEPYHSLSVWNYTPYGFKLLLEQAGFELVEIRPGVDAFTLLLRSLLGSSRVFNIFFKYGSPINRLIGFFGFIFRKNHRAINMVKLHYCGQFVFLARKKHF